MHAFFMIGHLVLLPLCNLAKPFVDELFDTVGGSRIVQSTTFNSWHASTNTPVSLRFTGNNLSSTDAIYIVMQSGSCAEEETPSSLDTGLRFRCPDLCSAVTNTDVNSASISIFATTGATTQCDDQWGKCRSSLIVDIARLNLHEVMLKFSESIDESIFVGDRIVIDLNSLICTVQSDCGIISGFMSGSGIVRTVIGNVITSIISADTVIVETFALSSTGASTSLQEPTSDWAITNRVGTRKEIMRPAESSNLKVCLSGESIGMISFLDPPGMKTATLFPASLMAAFAVPAIVAIGSLPSAMSLQEEWCVRLIFSDTEVLDLWTSDLESPISIPLGGTGQETEVACTSVLREFIGFPFPYPSRCTLNYYTRRKEFTIYFPRGSSPPQEILLEVAIKTSKFATKQSDVLHAQFVPRSVSKPFEVGLFGRVALAAQPRETGAISDGHFLNPGGFNIIGGENGVLDLRYTKGTFSAVVTGSAIPNSAIVAGTIVRITLMGFRHSLGPLPETITCETSSLDPNVLCDLAASQRSSVIRSDSIETESVTGDTGYRETVIFKLSTSPISGPVKFTFTFNQLPLPAKGFPPIRVGVELSAAKTRTEPDWILSTGDLVACSPEPMIIGARITSEGIRSFTGDRMDLRILIQLPWALKGGGKTAVGSVIRIKAPEGYVLLSGILHASKSIRAACADNSCDFNVSGFDFVLFETFAEFQVLNPAYSRRGPVSNNLWSVRVGTKGNGATNLFWSEPEPFPGYSVLDRMQETRMSFTNGRFSRKAVIGQDVGITESLNIAWVWVKAPSDSARRIVVQGPSWASFKTPCGVQDIEEFCDYSSRFPLSSIVTSCVAAGNVATVTLALHLLAGKSYIFGITLVNPTTEFFASSRSTSDAWLVSLVDDEGTVTAGTDSSAASDPDFILSSTATEISMTSNQCSSVMRQDTLCDFQINLKPSADAHRLSLILPSGIQWVTMSPSRGTVSIADNLATLILAPTGDAVTASTTVKTLSSSHSNLSRISVSAYSNGGEAISFDAIALPPLAAIYGGRIAWSSSAVGTSNNVSITVTSSSVWSWLRVTLPRGHTSAQPPVLLKGGNIVKATFQWSVIGSVYAVQVSVATPEPPGTVMVSLLVQNAGAVISSGFNSLLIETDFGSSISIAGFPIYEKMTSLEVVPDSANQQPARVNHLQLLFHLKWSRLKRISGEQVFYKVSLTAPENFRFHENCLGSISLGSEWPQQSVVSRCQGRNDVAYLTVSSGTDGFLSSTTYSFGIDVVNPSSTSEAGKFRLVFDDQVAEVEAFPLHTFFDLSMVYSMSNLRSGNEINFVTFNFRPTSTIGTAREQRLVITAPSKFFFASNAVSLIEDGLETLQPVTDFTATLVAGDSEMHITFSGLKNLTSAHSYELVLSALNPTQMNSQDVWTISSWSGTNLMDRTEIPSQPLTRSLPRFNMTASASEVYGGTSVGLSITATMGVRIDETDIIRISLPLGYDLDCPSFYWFRGLSHESANHACSPDENVLDITVGAIAFPAVSGTELMFEINAVAPLRTPKTGLNSFTISHFRSTGYILEAATVSGLTITTQLREVTVSNVGRYQISNSYSTIRVSFTPTSAADTVEVIFVDPSGFDFSRAKIVGPGLEIANAIGNRIILRAQVIPDTPFRATIEEVKLGNTPGQAVVDILTRDASRSVADKALRFNGFDIPQTIDVIPGSLTGFRSDLPVRFGDSISHLTISTSLPDGQSEDQLIMYLEGLKITAIGSSDVTVTQFNATHALFECPLNKTKSSIKAHVTPPRESSTSIGLRLDLRRAGKTIASSDFQALSGILGIVHQISVNVLPLSTLHTPPNAFMTLVLNTATVSARVSKFALFSPAGFMIRQDCFQGIMGPHSELYSCEGVATRNGSSTAVLHAVPEGIDIVSGTRITARSPKSTPDTNSWILVGYDNGDNIVAWGESQGFDIQQLSEAKLLYTAISSDQVRSGSIPSPVLFALGFRLNYQTFLVKSLRITLPSLFEYRGQVAFTKLPWTGSVNAWKDSKRLFVELPINDTMIATDYGISFTVLTPFMTPALEEDRSIAIELLDGNDEVVDGIYTLVMSPTKYGIPIAGSVRSAFRKEDLSTAINDLSGLSTQESAFMQSAQLSAFRESFEFDILGPIKFTNITELEIRLPVGIRVNPALLKLDATRLGLKVSDWLEPFVANVELLNDARGLKVVLVGGWTQAAFEKGRMFISCGVTLPQNDPLPAFNIYSVAFVSNSTVWLEYPFRGHMMSDAPVASLMELEASRLSHAPSVTLNSAITVLALVLINLFYSPKIGITVQADFRVLLFTHYYLLSLPSVVGSALNSRSASGHALCLGRLLGLFSPALFFVGGTASMEAGGRGDSSDISVGLSGRASSETSFTLALAATPSEPSESTTAGIRAHRLEPRRNFLLGLFQRSPQFVENSAIGFVYERSSRSCVSSSSSTPDAMNVVVDVGREIEVDNVVNVGDIETSGSNIRGNQNWKSS